MEKLAATESACALRVWVCRTIVDCGDVYVVVDCDLLHVFVAGKSVGGLRYDVLRATRS